MQYDRDFRSHIDVRFRPSLIIFGDEAGKRICEQLKRIVEIARFDEVLHQCVALLQVKTGEEEDESSTEEDAEPDAEEDDKPIVEEDDGLIKAVPIPVGEQFPEFDNNMPEEPGYLDDLIEHALISIRLDSRVSEVMDAGYPVPEARPQIYIVGDAHSEELKAIHASVQRLLMRRGLPALVCYVLDAYEGVNVGARPQVEDPLAPQETSYWKQHEVPNFCFFFESEYYHRRLHTVTQAESNYAAAEMLFALIATGITPEPSFQQFVRLPPNLTTYSNVGSIGTTLIIFPREEILEYCNARLGIALLRQWQKDIDSGLLPENRRVQLQGRAYRDVEKLESWIKDVKTRPESLGDALERARHPQNGAQNERQEYTCPTLDILREKSNLVTPRVLVQHQALYRDVLDRTRALFRLFHYGDIGAEARKQRKRRDTWMRVADQRAMRAPGIYAEWDQVASSAWDAAGTRVGAEVKREVDLLWSSRENGTFGFEMAKTYTDAYYERFTKLQDHLVRLRDIHLRDYQDSMDTFAALSEGEWLRTQNIVNDPQRAAPAQRAAPRVAGYPPVDAPMTGGAGDNGENGEGEEAPGGGGAPQHLDAREEQIAIQLEARVQWLQDQVPSILTQFTISLPFVLAAILTGLAMYPHGNLVFVLGLALAVIVSVCVLNWAFWKRYQRRVEEARMDLLRFYRRVYAYRCEQREDELRLLVTNPLRDRLLTMRQRLDDMSGFIGAMQLQLDTQARTVRRDLFNSPSGVRNVYVANGERLQSSRKNTIEDFEALVTHQRETNPVQGCEWHQSLHAMKEELIEVFRTLDHSILEMEIEEAREHISGFASDINSAYLRGQLVDIRRALDKKEVWMEAFERAQSPLYRAEVGPREPQMVFVCGQWADLNDGQRFWPRGATSVLISDNHDWVLIAALFSGGLPPVFDPDTLFPPKHRLSGAIGAITGDGHDSRPAMPPPPPDYPGDSDFDEKPHWAPVAYPHDDDIDKTPPTPPDEELVGGKAGNAYMPPPNAYMSPEETWYHELIESSPPDNPVTPLPLDATDYGTGASTPPAQDLSRLAARFQRYERHLAHHGLSVSPTEDIDDPDLDHPIPYRLTQIGRDTQALETFVNKNMSEYQRFASRLAQEHDNGLNAYYASKSAFAVRYGQRALGLPEERLLPWPERLQNLFGYVQNPELQRLVKEDMTLTRAKVVNTITPLPPGSMEAVVDEKQGHIIAPRMVLPARKQEDNDAAQQGRFDSKKMRAIRLNHILDQVDVIEPGKEP